MSDVSLPVTQQTDSEPERYLKIGTTNTEDNGDVWWTRVLAS